MCFIGKPKKDASKIGNRRGLHLTDAGAQIYYKQLNAEIKQDMHDKWDKQAYGGVESRSTLLAITMIMELISRAKRAKKHMYMYNSDGTKAYDLIDRNKVCGSIHATLTNKATAARIVDRHSTTYNHICVGKSDAVVLNDKGVVQGDSNGPICFNIGYQQFGCEIDNKRKSRDIQSMQAVVDANPIMNAFTANLNKSFFVDDHAEFGIFDRAMDIRRQLKPVTDTQPDWNVITNWEKTHIMMAPHGKGAAKLRKQIKQVNIAEHQVQVFDHTTYLGTVIEANGCNNLAVAERLRQTKIAWSAMYHIWNSEVISRRNKLMFYATMIRTVMLYGMEARVLTKGQNKQLEGLQTRYLRRILNEPAHLGRKTNRQIRVIANIPSVESHLQIRRLRMWKGALTTDLQTGKIKNYNGFIAVFFGKMQWDPITPDQHNSAILRQLRNDLTDLARVIRGTDDFAESLHSGVLQWFARLHPDVISQVESFDSQTELHDRIGLIGPRLPPTHHCPECALNGITKSFHELSSLQTHRWSVHSHINLKRYLVCTKQCPHCTKWYKTQEIAKKHYQQVCSKKVGAELEAIYVARADAFYTSTTTARRPTAPTVAQQEQPNSTGNVPRGVIEHIDALIAWQNQQ